MMELIIDKGAKKATKVADEAIRVRLERINTIDSSFAPKIQHQIIEILCVKF